MEGGGEGWTVEVESSHEKRNECTSREEEIEKEERKHPVSRKQREKRKTKG